MLYPLVGRPPTTGYNLDVTQRPRRTKIVCTLGPASNSPEVIEALINAGMNCARLNFSHGSHEEHRAVSTMLREASRRLRKPLAILADLQGPKMRIGRFGSGPITLEPGAPFLLTVDAHPGNQAGVSVTYEHLPHDVSPGDHIALDDGLLLLEVTRVDGNDVHTQVVLGGPLSNNKGLNLPGVPVSAPAMTQKDREDLEFAVNELHVDYAALSFVRHASDIELAREVTRTTPIIAKIERPEAVDGLIDIITAFDGIMVARGDLGVEVGPEKVPLIQKRIIRETNNQGKIVITATQMLDSMTRNPRPTRAETTDVANAVMDGTDAVMLSGETAAGKYPVESVRMMDAIVRDVETEFIKTQHADVSHHPIDSEWTVPNAAARSAALLSMQLPIGAIVVFTRDGRSAGLVAEHRPNAPIVAITSRQEVAQRLALTWGVLPYLEVPPESLEETLRTATQVLARERLCSPGEAFAMLVGWPTSGQANTVKLHRL